MNYNEKVQKNGLALKDVPSDGQTEVLCLAGVRENPAALKYVAKQTYRIRQAAIKNDGLALQYVDKQTPALREMAIKRTPEALVYFDEQTIETIAPVLYLLNGHGRNAKVFDYIDTENQTEELILAIIENNSNTFAYLSPEKQTPAIRKVALKGNASYIKYMSDQTEEEQLTALKGINSGYWDMFKTFTNPTENVIEKGLKGNAAILSYVEPEQITEKMIKIALKSKYGVQTIVKYIPKEMQTQKIANICVKERGEYIEFVKPEFQTKSLQLSAVMQSSSNIKYISKPKKSVIKEMLRECPDSIRHIKKPSDSLQVFANKQRRKMEQMFHHPFMMRGRYC